MIEFDRRIKSLRKSRGITQEQLAGYLEISPQAVSRWETGASCPDISLLPQIAGLFEITVDELLGVNETEKRREIQAVVAETSAMIDKNITEEPIRTLRAALKKYRPDVTIFIDLTPEAAFLRKHGADENDRLEQAGMEFHKRVYAGYKALAADEPERIVCVDGNKTPQEIFADVVDVLKKRGCLE